ncbi:MAG: hypothetical protein J6P03_06795 [Opitutales bacterium]|nr:hypothetical protein [Opitutales bacterium]
MHFIPCACFCLVKQVVHSKSKGALLAYDSRNRIHTGNNRTYSYNLCGRILSVSDSGNSLENVSYTYDALGRTVSETTNRGKRYCVK